MSKIIALMNNKGGILKTTLATNISGILSKNKKVLLVDTDPQSNIATTFGINADNFKITLTEVLLDNKDVNKAIQKDIVFNLDLLPSSAGLNRFSAFAYSGKLKQNNIQNVLQNVLQPLKKKYDYIIIDSAPYMDILSINIIKIADYIIVPAQMELYASKGLIKLISDVIALDGKIKWIVPTLYDNRTIIHKQMLSKIKDIAKENDIKVTENKITKSIQATNAMAYERVPLVLTNFKTKQVKQYYDIVKEMKL